MAYIANEKLKQLVVELDFAKEFLESGRTKQGYYRLEQALIIIEKEIDRELKRQSRINKG